MLDCLPTRADAEHRVDRLAGSVVGTARAVPRRVQSLVPNPQVSPGVLTQSLKVNSIGRRSLASGAAHPAKGNTVAKGQVCPRCGTNTMQPHTTNQLKCSNCGLVEKKK